MPDFGAFVLSLDFELHWGVRDHCRPEDPYRQQALTGLRVLPRILDIFEEFEIAATWAAVGFLFARSRRELEEEWPGVRPSYECPALDPYQEQIGQSEEDDPLHYAPGAIREILRRPRQEVASHTFSHYCCLEPGQDRQAFAADMKAAVSIAAKQGITLQSLIFPRNQVNREYLDLLPQLGISAYRGNPRSWMHRPAEKSRQRMWAKRGARLLDAYVPVTGQSSQAWGDEMLDIHGLWNIRADGYLRPYAPALAPFEALRLHRIFGALKSAALSNRIFHLWFHPHDFGAYPEQNLNFLRSVCAECALWRRRSGLRSLNMREVVATGAPGVAINAPAASEREGAV